MLEVTEPILLEHTLSRRTLDTIMRHVGMSIYELLSPGTDWILGEKSISKEGQSYLDSILRPLGYRLQTQKPERNALIAYEHVKLHNDEKLELKYSTVFIPVKTPPGTRFLHFDRNKKAHIIPLDVGSILIFDQNHDHKLVFPRDEDDQEDASLKIGIALCLDKISS